MVVVAVVNVEVVEMVVEVEVEVVVVVMVVDMCPIWLDAIGARQRYSWMMAARGEFGFSCVFLAMPADVKVIVL